MGRCLSIVDPKLVWYSCVANPTRPWFLRRMIDLTEAQGTPEALSQMQITQANTAEKTVLLLESKVILGN